MVWDIVWFSLKIIQKIDCILNLEILKENDKYIWLNLTLTFCGGYKVDFLHI